MKDKLFGSMITILLLACMAINVFILMRIWFSLNTDSVLREKKASYILPDGISPMKTNVAWDDSFSSPSGWVVRYASRGCIYCNLDYEWENLIPIFERYHYRTILLLPKESDQFDENQIQSIYIKQMAYAKVDWIKQFRFTGTPTVIIFDNNGRVLWHRSGMLKETDYKSAEKAIVKNAKR